MTTQKQIKEWIPTAVETFQRFMPCPEIPEIHIVSEKTLFKRRAEIVERLQAKQKNASSETYDIIMEMIHGDLGNAILIRQKYITSTERNHQAEEEFSHLLWHELGHYVAITSENDAMERFMDHSYHIDYNINSTEFVKREGYYFWSEFIAESIANYVSMKFNQTKNDYHPEQEIREPYQWQWINHKLQEYLDSTVNYFRHTIDEPALGYYFALLLTNDYAIHYRKAAVEGDLKVYDSNGVKSLLTGGKIEPTCIDSIPAVYREPLEDMMSKLEKQLEIQKFWIISEDYLEEIGELVFDLLSRKILYLACRPFDKLTIE